jgi:hypothetical protein
MTITRRRLLLTLSFLTLSPATFAASTAMNPQQFWKIVELVKTEAGDDVDARPRVLQKHLMALEPAAIQGFQIAYEALQLQANSWSLWGAAYIMNGGCSDDGFIYFRDWLISEGEQTYKTAVANPDSLVALTRRDYFELEAFGYAALKAYAAKGMGELERDFKVEYAVTTGEEFTVRDLPTRLPALSAKYHVTSQAPIIHSAESAGTADLPEVAVSSDGIQTTYGTVLTAAQLVALLQTHKVAKVKLRVVPEAGYERIGQVIYGLNRAGIEIVLAARPNGS